MYSSNALNNSDNIENDASLLRNSLQISRCMLHFFKATF